MRVGVRKRGLRRGTVAGLRLLFLWVRDVLSGELFVFVGRNRRRAKVLFFDGTGLCLYHKRLETGRFACLWRDPATAALALSASELALFLEGCALIGKTPLSPPPLCRSALRSSRR